MHWDYNEIKMHGTLSEFIDCIWWENYSNIDPQNNRHLLIPDNSIELIFTNSAIKRLSPTNQEYKIRKSQLAGLRTLPQDCIVNKSPIISVRFIPNTFYLLCKTELINTINTSLAIKECFGQSVLDLEKAIFRASSQEDRIHQIEAYFEKYLKSQSSARDNVFERIVNHIDNSKGDCMIGEFPNRFNISASTIERKFKKNLGLTPKKYCMLVRFVNQFLSGKKEFNSYDNKTGFNYHDQAHFIKEVGRFSGLTPKQLTSLNIGIQRAYFRNKAI